MLNHPCILGLNPTWSGWVIFLDMLLYSIGWYFVEDFWSLHSPLYEKIASPQVPDYWSHGWCPCLVLYVCTVLSAPWYLSYICRISTAYSRFLPVVRIGISSCYSTIFDSPRLLLTNVYLQSVLMVRNTKFEYHIREIFCLFLYFVGSGIITLYQQTLKYLPPCFL